MAFKMKGNPFPKKGGAFKQDTTIEYQQKLDAMQDDYTEYGDSMNVILNKLKLESDKLGQDYQDGKVLYKDYEKSYNLYQDFLNKYKEEDTAKLTSMDTELKEFGDSLDNAVNMDLIELDKMTNKYKNDEITRLDFEAFVKNLKEKRGSSIIWPDEKVKEEE